MSHEVETMMYAGATPWHKLGNKVAGLQTAKEALVAAGLDWMVEPVSVFIKGKGRQFIEVPDYRAVKRLTDSKVLSVVGVDYTPVQNKDAFKFFDKLVVKGKAAYETAGSLYGGKRIWILVNMNATFAPNTAPDEEIRQYMLLLNSFDQSLAFQVFHTNVRAVCANTVRMALAGTAESERFYAKHTPGLMDRVMEAQQILRLVKRDAIDYQKAAEHLASIALPPAKVPLLLAASFGLQPAQKVADFTYIKEGKKVPISAYWKDHVEECHQTIMEGTGQKTSTRGTAYWGYNGVVEYVDHVRKYRGNGEPDDNNVRGAFFGSGANIKKRAWDYVTGLK
jgi:phage/plasmid-like protein (TIGR03299 family)